MTQSPGFVAPAVLMCLCYGVCTVYCVLVAGTQIYISRVVCTVSGCQWLSATVERGLWEVVCPGFQKGRVSI